MTKKVALVGAGAMGGAIGKRLLETGTSLRIFNRSPERIRPLVEIGAEVAGSAADAVRDAHAVILCLNSPDIVRRAVFGQDGVTSGAPEGLLLIDMSSIDPVATARMAVEAKEFGIRWVDSPLSGGPTKAYIGELTLMQGGEPDAVAAAQDVLANVAANQTRMGDAGSGQTTKLINQVLCGLNFLAVAEATALIQGLGMDATIVPAALKGGRGDSSVLQEYMFKFATRDYRRTGRIDNMVKDLDGVKELARRAGVSMPITTLCAEIHRMLTAAGLGGEDQAALMEFFGGPDRSRFPA